MKSLPLTAFLASAVAAGPWKTADNKLYYNNQETVLHGFSTTCTEYLLRGIGMTCWAEYNWSDAGNIITSLRKDEVDAVKGYFQQISAPGIMPALRVPMTASYWLGNSTKASDSFFRKYPNLGGQY